MNRVYLMLSLTWFFLKNPWSSLNKMSFHNLRRVISAMYRYDRTTVMQIAQNELRNTNELHFNKPSDAHSASGLRKARELEKRYPGITKPVAIGSTYVLEEKLAPPKYKIDQNALHRVNILLPQLDPLIFFGGYISCFQFIRKIQEDGFNVRILICESNKVDRRDVENKLSSNPPLQLAVSASEIVNFSNNDTTIEISPEDNFVCYSFWTGIKAHHLAKAIGKKFIFFLQEFEAIFHSCDSYYAIADYVYRLPHRAIFNTNLLADYFRRKHIGVFRRYQGDELERHYVTYQHALTPTSPPTLAEFSKRKTKRLLFYGRPEEHARRNLFEIALIGLKIAVFNGVFSSDWEFHGVGTLGAEYELELGLGHKMRLSGTLPQKDYGEALRDFDIGLSLMFAPHPSILPFEMASAGQIVVTNSFEDRTAEVLKAISGNIEPCEPEPQSIANALAKAIDRVPHYENRIKGAGFDWARNWDESFNDGVMTKITKMLSA